MGKEKTKTEYKILKKGNIIDYSSKNGYEIMRKVCSILPTYYFLVYLKSFSYGAGGKNSVNCSIIVKNLRSSGILF